MEAKKAIKRALLRRLDAGVAVPLAAVSLARIHRTPPARPPLPMCLPAVSGPNALRGEPWIPTATNIRPAGTCVQAGRVFREPL